MGNWNAQDFSMHYNSYIFSEVKSGEERKIVNPTNWPFLALNPAGYITELGIS